MSQPISYQQPPETFLNPDLGHLKTLSICHYVWGGLTILFSSIFIVHIVMGVFFLKNPGVFTPPAGAPGTPPPPAPPPDFLGYLFIIMGSVLITLGWTMGILTIISGRRIAQRRSRTFSLVMAGVNCLSVPIGTTLGVFTFIVLSRPSVQALYDRRL